MIRGVVLGLAIAATIAGCVVRHLVPTRMTGTCDGACAHYVECKAGQPADGERCRRECPDVFSDRDSLMAFESLSCQDTVEFVDGTTPRAAAAKN